MFCTVDEVKQITLTEPNDFELKPDDTTGLNSIISAWIAQAEDMIKSYCERDFEEYDPVPLTVKNVCIRLVANMIAFQYVRRDGPIIKVNDWNKEVSSSKIFTDDLKEDLKPYKRKKKVSIFSF